MKTSLILTFALGLASTLPAQQQSNQHLASLEVPSLVPGNTATFRIRSTAVGQPARIMVGKAIFQPLAPPNGLLLVDATHGTRFQGVIGADGLFSATVPLPVSLPVPAGFPVAVQGGVRTSSGAAVLTDRAFSVVSPSTSTDFTNNSAFLPPSANVGSGEMIAFDLDRDGDRDLVLSGDSGLRFFINQDGTLVDETNSRFPALENEIAFTVLNADFNRDGHQDLLIASRVDWQDMPMAAVIYHNDGNGFFGSAIGRTVLPLALEAHAIPAIGDVDGDGDLDILITDGGYHSGGQGAQNLTLLRDQGGLQAGLTGDYQEDSAFSSASFNQTGETAAGIDFGDADNDGDLDIAVARITATGTKNLLLTNDGSGVFTDSSAQLPNFLDKSSDVEFADLDQDGYLDLIFMNSHVSIAPSDSGDVLFNSGASNPGTFVDAGTRFPDQYDEDLQIRLFSLTADVDADGDLDVIMMPHEFFSSTGYLVGQPGLFVNQGGAQGGILGSFLKDLNFFHNGANPYGTFVSSGGALFDLDSDGDLEFYVGSSGGIVNPLATGDFLLENVLL